MIICLVVDGFVRNRCTGDVTFSGQSDSNCSLAVLTPVTDHVM